MCLTAKIPHLTLSDYLEYLKYEGEHIRNIILYNIISWCRRGWMMYLLTSLAILFGLGAITCILVWKLYFEPTGKLVLSCTLFTVHLTLLADNVALVRSTHFHGKIIIIIINIYLSPKNTSTVMLGTEDYEYSNSGNTKVKN